MKRKMKMKILVGGAVICASASVIAYGVYCLNKASQSEKDFFDMLIHGKSDVAFDRMPWLFRKLMK